MSFRALLKESLPQGLVEAVEYANARRVIRERSATGADLWPTEIARLYQLNTGKTIDFDNPVTYNEKIQWMKAFCSGSEYGRLADKYLVREFVSDRVGAKYLTKLYGVWDDAGEIDFSQLPEKFALKATHGCQWNVIVSDKASMNERVIRRRLSRWLKLNYAFISDFELHYRFCEPRIIAEEYLTNGSLADGSGDDLWDYKFWCFGGKCHYIQFLSNRSAGLDMAFLSPQWELMPFVYSYPRHEGEIERPDNLDEMIEVAEALSDGFPHVRVDLYRMADGRIVFGEMTFTSMGGYCDWNPPEANYELGKLFELPEKLA